MPSKAVSLGSRLEEDEDEEEEEEEGEERGKEADDDGSEEDANRTKAAGWLVVTTKEAEKVCCDNEKVIVRLKRRFRDMICVCGRRTGGSGGRGPNKRGLVSRSVFLRTDRIDR